MKIGYSGHYHVEKRDNDRYIGDRLIEGKNCHPMYFSLRSRAKSIMLDKQFGTAGNRMVIEEFMTGREVSVLSFVDGKKWGAGVNDNPYR